MSEFMTELKSPHLEPDAYRQAAELLRQKQIVAFPTETVYGLGAHALDADAVRRIYEAKGRPANNPVIVHVTGTEMLADLVAEWPKAAQTLAEKYWPGPLTIVVRRSERVPSIVTAGGATIAVRCPAHPVAQHLLRTCGLPLAAPSANRSTELSPTRAEHVLKSLGSRIPLILDGGPTESGIESTVIDLSRERPTVLRPGPIALSDLQKLLGDVIYHMEAASTDKPLASPGLMHRHYAPNTPLHLLSLQEIEQLRTPESGVITLETTFPEQPHQYRLGREPHEYARQLYDTLHRFDALGLRKLLVESPPETPEWEAIRDRLSRASQR